MDKFLKIDSFLNTGINNCVFTGASVLSSQKSIVEFNEVFGANSLDLNDYICKDTFFDLASLTKPMATTLFFLLLWQKKKIFPDTKIYKLTGIKNFKNISVSNLLLHDSGLPAHRHYYRELSEIPFHERELFRLRKISNEKLIYKTGENTLYSDLGFMVLKFILEKIADMRMSEYLKYNFYDKIGADLFFSSQVKKSVHNFCSTSYSLFRNKRLRGEVHDDNAFFIGGEDGHAGLFGNSLGIHKVLDEIYKAYNGKKGLLCSDLTRQLFNKKEKKRFLGFDVAEEKNSSAGKYFSKNTAGHLGFTGTSFWIDFERGVWIILLTNRVYYGDNNLKIRFFRPKFHDLMNNLL